MAASPCRNERFIESFIQIIRSKQPICLETKQVSKCITESLTQMFRSKTDSFRKKSLHCSNKRFMHVLLQIFFFTEKKAANFVSEM